jgi:large subunit ribosomal protein L23
MSKTVALKPHVSEKAYGLSEKGVYVFDVPLDANKPLIRQAVEAQFKVTVSDIRMVLTKGKTKRVVRKRQRPITGRRSDSKKCYVTLKSGERIGIFPEAK